MSNWKNDDLNVGVRGIPDDWTTEQKDAFVRSVGQTEDFTGARNRRVFSFEEAQELLNSAPIGGAPRQTPLSAPISDLYRPQQQPMGPPSPPPQQPMGPPSPPPQQPMTANERRLAELEEDAAAVAQADDDNRFRRAWGEVMGVTKEMMDSMIRGAAPTTAGAAAGFMFGGLPAAVLGAVAVPAADAIVTGINAALGQDFRTPSEAVNGWLQEKLNIQPSDQMIFQTLEMATQAFANSYAATGLLGNIASGPSAGTTMNSAPGTQILRGPNGQPINPTTGRVLASQMANLPGINAASTIPSTFVQEGSANLLENLGLNPQLANTLAFFPSLLTDIGFNMGAEGLIAGLDAAAGRQLPVPENVQRQIDLTQQMNPNDPLTFDEAVMLNNPTQREASGVARRMGSADAGTQDTMTRRVQTQSDRIGQFAQEQGIEFSDYGNANVLRDDHLGKILEAHGTGRRAEFDQLIRQRGDVIGGLSRPEWPVPTTQAEGTIDDLVASLGQQNDVIFQSTIQELEALKANLKRGLPLEDVYKELQRIRSSVGDEMIPQGVRGARDMAFKEIGASLREDIDSFIENNAMPESLDRLNIINEQLENLVEDFNDKPLAQVINEFARNENRRTVDTIQGIVKPDADMNMARQFYDELTPEGQRLTQQTIFGDILQKSYDGNGNFSPDAFNQATAEYEQWLDLMRTETKAMPVDDIVNEYGLIEAENIREMYDPEPLDQLDQINQFTREVVTIAEQLGSGDAKAIQRLGLGANPTAGIALSQAVRKLGIGFGLFMGDVISGSFGTIARSMQRPEVRNLLMSLRSYTPGSERYLEGMKRVMRQMYIEEIRAQDAIDDGLTEE